jgi:molecular chaperone DnaJ
MDGDRSGDHYAVLGVTEDVGPSELRRAWRRLALRWHPDRAGEWATARFQMLAAAYAVLSSPSARAEYDRRRGVTVHAASGRRREGGDPAAHAPPAPTRRAPSVMLRRISGPLNALLASGTAARAEPGVIDLFLKADEASEGGMASIALRVPVRCDPCEGANCPRCRGGGTAKELYTAWLAVRPGVANGTLLTPSMPLRGMIEPVQFRVRLRS